MMSIVVIVFVIMPSMSLMHEDVHNWAEQENKVWQGSQQMRSMLGPQEESANSDKKEKYKVINV